MKALIVYESMYGNTHAVAERIAQGLRARGEVTVVTAAEATPQLLHGVDLLVVGGPTHAHGLTTSSTRRAAHDAAVKPGSSLQMDGSWEGPGLRDWFGSTGDLGGIAAAAFDTRFNGPALFTGRASRGITRRLRAHGAVPIEEPESFLVDRDNHLLDGEGDRAEVWGRELLGAEVAAAV